jgi:hypothetical protein
MNVTRHLLLIALGLSPAVALGQAKPKEALKPIEIADVKHDGPVDFEKEILPIFRRNCLACHSATEAQSDLTLETPQSILKGGSEGPSVVAGKSAESLLLKLASRQKEPVMPPPDNDVKAKPLSSQELGLIKKWIDEGAKGDVKAANANIVWQPLPAGVNPIYAVALTSDGQYAAVARANQIFLYHIPSKRELGRLTDPELLKKGLYTAAGVADLDLIQSLKFSPDNTLLASGGFRSFTGHFGRRQMGRDRRRERQDSHLRSRHRQSCQDPRRSQRPYHRRRLQCRCHEAGLRFTGQNVPRLEHRRSERTRQSRNPRTRQRGRAGG